MDKIILSGKSGNYIVTVAIGNKYLDLWEKYAKLNWTTYCKRNNLGLIVITNDLIEKKNRFWKKPNWQKLLIGEYLKNKYSNQIKNVCYLDTDILINPFSPNVFKFHDENKISVVSSVNDLPYNLNETRKKVSYLRNNFYSKNYPLDSSLFMSVKQLYKYHKLKDQKNFFVSGMFVFNIKNFSKDMLRWFFKYKKNIVSVTDGGEQTHVNYEFFKTKKIKILDYKFQAIWIYEMAEKFPFLYNKKLSSKKLIIECVEKSLLDNYFLHFAGRWYEADMWKINGIFPNKKIKFYENYYKYLKKKQSGKPKGVIIPQGREFLKKKN